MQSFRAIRYFRFIHLKNLFPLITLLGVIFSLFQNTQPVKADVNLSIQPLTWDVVGLDSNNVNVGPNNFPVGVRACNAAGADPATGVTATFTWTSSTNSAYIYSRPASYTTIPGPTEADITINPGACRDFYYEVEVTRDPDSRGKARPYQITVTADGGVSLTYPQAPQSRQVYVEWLVSQSRNYTTNVTLDGANVDPGGTMTLMVGSTYTITLYGSTATNGYEQIETFINFPNTIFQVNSVTTTYTAVDTTSPDPWAGSKLYADGCNWENDPASLNYRSCLGVGKYGGTISVAYNVTIIAGSGTTKTLNTLIYDFSGSSYHYNADFSTNGRIIRIVNASLEKAFEPKTILPGGSSTLTFTLTNPGTATLNNLNFSDPLPLGLTVASGSLTNVCNSTGTVTLTHNTPPAPDTIALSGASLAAGASCSFPVIVTASSTASGLYTNTTNNLFIGASDTEDNASDYLQVTSLPAPPSSCTTRAQLASWDFTTDTTATILRPDVSFATATYAPAPPGTSGVNDGYWYGTHWLEDTTPNPPAPPNFNAAHFQFDLDTRNYGNVDIAFSGRINANGNWKGTSNSVRVWSSANGGAYALTGTDDSNLSITWTPFSRVAPTTGTNNTTFRIQAYYAKKNNTPAAQFWVDNVVISGCPRPNAPTLSKAFQTDPIVVGNASVLRFNLHNPNASSLTGVAFTDTLPTGLVINTPNGLSTTCSFGTAPISATAGTRTISLSGATLAANESCTIDVNVQGATAGYSNNLTSNITSIETGPNTTSDGYGEDSLTVIAPPIIDKSFGANAILTGNNTPLTFSIVNPNTSTTLTGVSFTDTLPSGLDVTNDSFPNVCNGSGSLATNNNDPLQDTVVLSGASLAPGTSCTFSITVEGTTTGLKQNTIQVTSTNGGTGNNVAADLLVRDPVFSLNFLKQVGPAINGPWSSHLVLYAGDNVYYRVVVENTGDQPLTNVVVTDNDIPTTLDPSTCTWYHLEGNPESPVNYADADGNPGNGFQLTIPAPSAVNNMHVAYCVLGPVTALADLRTNHAAADSNETTLDADEASYYGKNPAIQVTKTADDNSVPETGQSVTFTYIVENMGNVSLEITILSDSVFGVLVGDADCQVGTTLAVGASCTFDYTTTLSGNAGTTHTNLFTAQAEDDGGKDASASESEDVTFEDVLPDITVLKTANPTSVPESGGDVTFTFRVINNSLEDATIASLFDNVFGMLAGDADCRVGTVWQVKPSASSRSPAGFPASTRATSTTTFSPLG